MVYLLKHLTNNKQILGHYNHGFFFYSRDGVDHADKVKLIMLST